MQNKKKFYSRYSVSSYDIVDFLENSKEFKEKVFKEVRPDEKEAEFYNLKLSRHRMEIENFYDEGIVVSCEQEWEAEYNDEAERKYILSQQEEAIKRLEADKERLEKLIQRKKEELK